MNAVTPTIATMTIVKAIITDTTITRALVLTERNKIKNVRHNSTSFITCVVAQSMSSFPKKFYHICYKYQNVKHAVK